MRDWLAIGLDLISLKNRPTDVASQNPPEQAPPPLAAAPAGRCISGSDGMEGTVGGVFHHSVSPIGVTCRHVLSSECGSLYWPGPPIRLPQQEFTADCPDAAFIRMGAPCFAQDGHRELNVVPATQADIELAVERRAKIQKNRAGARKGIILFAAVSGFRLGIIFTEGLTSK
jgi:hypothetical protein